MNSAANTPMIIRTAQLSLITKEFDKARANLEAILKRHRGYVGELKAGGSTGSGRTLTATLRVPADQLDATLTEVKTLGRVESESQSGQDVTSQYVDLQARLANARNTEQRLTDLLRNRTGKLSDVLEVEQELDRVRGEIEQMEAERKNMANQVSFATLNATITGGLPSPAAGRAAFDLHPSQQRRRRGISQHGGRSCEPGPVPAFDWAEPAAVGRNPVLAGPYGLEESAAQLCRIVAWQVAPSSDPIEFSSSPFRVTINQRSPSVFVGLEQAYMQAFDEHFEVVVVGAGHAGCEAAMAAARMGLKTALYTLNVDLIAQMSCNPAVGGIAKGHLVREVDALGGIMGEITDAVGIQFRLLNTSRGPAVWSPRAQCDKQALPPEDARSARVAAEPEDQAGGSGGCDRGESLFAVVALVR